MEAHSDPDLGLGPFYLHCPSHSIVQSHHMLQPRLHETDAISPLVALPYRHFLLALRKVKGRRLANLVESELSVDVDLFLPEKRYLGQGLVYLFLRLTPLPFQPWGSNSI